MDKYPCLDPVNLVNKCPIHCRYFYVWALG